MFEAGNNSRRLASAVRFINVLKTECLADKDNARAITLAEEYGYLLWKNPIGIYRDDSIENELIGRYVKIIKINESHESSGKILHVISNPYSSGGHTRLMERLVSIQPDSSDVLVTRPYSQSDGAIRLPDEINVICKNEQYSINELVDIIARYKTVVMHIHPDDISAALSIGLVRQTLGLRVIFINHADHVFSYGLQSADIVAEVSSFGMELSSEKRSVTSSFLGIPLEMGGLSILPGHGKKSLDVFSGGSPSKYKPSNGYSFPALAVEILRNLPNAKITVIGPKFMNYWWWAPKIRYFRRLTTHPVLPYEKYIKLVENADLYIDSLPMAGGTALPEARAKGLPVTGITTGAIGYTPFDMMKFENSMILISELKKMSNNEANLILEGNNSEMLLSQAIQWHGIESVGDRFKALLNENCIITCANTPKMHDISFYEVLWREENVMNVTPTSFDFAFGLKGMKKIQIIFLLAQAISFRQKLTFTEKYMNYLFKSKKLC